MLDRNGIPSVALLTKPTHIVADGHSIVWQDESDQTSIRLLSDLKGSWPLQEHLAAYMEMFKLCDWTQAVVTFVECLIKLSRFCEFLHQWEFESSRRCGQSAESCMGPQGIGSPPNFALS